MPHFLLQSDDSFKVIFGIVAFIVWIVMSVASAINKQTQKRKQQELQRQFPVPDAPPAEEDISLGEMIRRREQQMREILERQQQQQAPPEPPRPAPPPPPPLPSRGYEPPTPRRPEPVQRREPHRRPKPVSPPKPSSRPRPRQVPPTVAATEQAASASTDFSAFPASTPDIAATEIRTDPHAPTSKSPRTATAAALNAWLKPSTLRQQFILTEILNPPVSLRPPKDQI